MLKIDRSSMIAAIAAAGLLVSASSAWASCAITRNTAAAEPLPKIDASKVVPASKLNPPMTDGKAYIDYMVKMRGDDPRMLAVKWGRFQAMVRNNDLRRDEEKRAFLLAPRERFSRTNVPARVYAHAFLSIGCGVTISGPHIVGRMTTELEIKPGDKVLEVGTGSGYQSSILSYLTDKVYTIEIIPPLAKVTDEIYTKLAGYKFPEYGTIKRKTADGYFGWEDQGPFDKIIVTAGIDHVPPPLLKQLAVGGTMVIPVGPPGAQALLKITKEKSSTGRIRIKRHDIYASDPSRAGGRRKTKVSFVAFTKYDSKGQVKSRWGK